ncbi:unannotated protein [freshwater metagenome]|uniref:Unannotated protein n=1 Tax=freshwater metagenome TaxID=449393 RepID=A0A6J7AMT6_9ZZZZ
MVSRGLCADVAEAHVLIEQSRVLVSGSIALNAARQVAGDDAISLRESPSEFVSRAGQKLNAALSIFDVAVSGRTVIDAGSATGGFTQCLLSHGACRVLSVDVGYGQLHELLRSDSRVVSLERTNIRSLTREEASKAALPEREPSMVTADLSFTSLRPLVSHLAELAGSDGDLIVLCKPQFEADHDVVSEGQGVIRSEKVRQSAIEGVCGALQAAGTGIMGVVNSPVLGPAGNAEFLIHARVGALRGVEDIDQQIAVSLQKASELR